MFPMGFSQQIKQNQQLLLTLAMQQAFVVLQMPILELSEWLETQIDQNPVLERKGADEYSQEQENEDPEFSRKENSSFDEETSHEGGPSEHLDEEFYFDSRSRIQQDSPFTYRETLFEHLMHQAKQTFTEKEDLHLAEIIIGELNEKGFLTTPLENLDPEASKEQLKHILATLQQFDPPGVAARTLQESLLIQLRLKGKQYHLSYQIIENHLEDLLHHRLSLIEKKCKCDRETLKKILKEEISVLDPYPGSRFQIDPNYPLVPDIIISKENQKWKIEINDSSLPRFKISSFYQNLLPTMDSTEQSYFRKQFASAKWLARIIKRRNQTILGIAKYILSKQADFFEKEGRTLLPMTMQEIADVLDVHESTIARAVSHKYLACPLGIFALRSFFTTSLNKDSKDISTDSAKKMLQKLIVQENKKRPLSDEDLLIKLKDLGFACARRTIAKYRKSLRIAPSYKRKIG